VSHLYQAFHPAVIRLVKKTIDAAKEAGIWVGVCGEMAGNPLGAALLLGLGVDELSVSPVLVPEIKTVIRSLTVAEARTMASGVLKAETQNAALAVLKEVLGDRMSELYLT
jgi:phosphotransferase system enzyme I (PtsI)